jgi:hypothetical protein
MHNYNALNRTAEKIINCVTEQTRHLNYPAIEDVYPIMRPLSKMCSPTGYSIAATFKHPITRFVTDNCERILGYPAEELRDLHKSAGLFARIHEEDLKDVHDCFSYIENFLKDFCNQRIQATQVCIFSTGCNTGMETILLYGMKKLLYQLMKSTIFYYCILKDLSNETIFSGVKLEIYKTADSFTKIAEYKPAKERRKLSKRENELVD